MEEKIRESLGRFFSGLLEVLQEEGEVEVREEPDGFYVNLRGPFKALPVNDPEFLGALARLAALHLRVNWQKSFPVEVDVNGQEESRRREIVARALALAEKAKREGKNIELEPMPPKDRRLVHLALANYPGVRTFSVGEGPERRVVIAPLLGC